MVTVIPFIRNDVLELSSNTYIVTDSFSSCIVIDPSRDDDKIKNYILSHNLNLKGILLTHAHFDHIRGVDSLVNYFNVPFFLLEEDEETLTNPIYNCSASYHKKENVIIKNKPTLIKDYEILKLLEEEDILVISTPFHTIGSGCYYFSNSNLLFSGDTLFKGSVGRDDLPTSISRKRRDSLAKIMSLNNDTKVYPGHGEITSIGIERIQNPFIN